MLSEWLEKTKELTWKILLNKQKKAQENGEQEKINKITKKCVDNFVVIMVSI